MSRKRSALALAPAYLRSAAILPFLFAIDRGETLLVPARMMTMGTTAERLVAVARAVGAPVIVLDDLDTIKTREACEA